MKILVTGATGTVGASVAKQLLGRGHHIAALVRNPEAATLPEGIEVIRGDLTNHDDVRRALAGVDRAFLNMAKDNGAVFAEAAAAAGEVLGRKFRVEQIDVDTAKTTAFSEGLPPLSAIPYWARWAPKQQPSPSPEMSSH